MSPNVRHFIYFTGSPVTPRADDERVISEILKDEERLRSADDNSTAFVLVVTRECGKTSTIGVLGVSTVQYRDDQTVRLDSYTAM